MTRIKRILAILLSLVLVMGLAIPAFAQDEAETDPYAPVITESLPEGQVVARTGFNLRLRVAAQLPEMPEGVEGALSYAWSYRGVDESTWIDIPSATSEKFVYKMTMDMVKAHNTTLMFRVVVTNTYIDDEGNEQRDSAASEARIFLTPSMIEIYLLYTDLDNLNTDYLFLLPLSLFHATVYGILNNIQAYWGTLTRWFKYH